MTPVKEKTAMARHNLAFLMGTVHEKPFIKLDGEGGAPYGWVYLCVVRGVRDAGDHQVQMKHDYPIIMTNNPRIIRDMATWNKGDVISVKGIIAAREIKKGSYCTHCGEKNSKKGSFLYVNPIYAKAITHYDSEEEGILYLSEHREISNQVFVFGKLCKDPVKMKTKSGLVFAKYQLALNRKFHIREDPPEVKSDYPWVSSYGENGISDMKRLHRGSEVFIDGCLQARSLMRQATCDHCGKEYTWKDNVLEIVPYDVEYLNYYVTDEELAAKGEK